jgi:hypothetical protein
MPWINENPADPLSARRYEVSKSEGTLVERHPDKQPSIHKLITAGDVCLMEVTREGVLVFREIHHTRYESTITVALYTWHEIQFDERSDVEM